MIDDDTLFAATAHHDRIVAEKAAPEPFGRTRGGRGRDARGRAITQILAGVDERSRSMMGPVYGPPGTTLSTRRVTH